MGDNTQFSEADDHVKIHADSLAYSLHKSMPKTFSLSKKCCIFKIPSILYHQKPKAFVPNAFSIGLWHHHRKQLKPVEEIKLNYLKHLISRWTSPEKKLKELIQAIEEIEEDVRAHYAEPIEMGVDDFVKLLVIDGCFIIEVFHRSYQENLILTYSNDEYNPILHMSSMTQNLYHDLILLENQIPWFVLELLFKMTMELGSPSLSLEQLGIMFFRNNFNKMADPLLISYRGKKHILDLLREWLVSLSNEKRDKEEGPSNALLHVVAVLTAVLRVVALRLIVLLQFAAILRIATVLRALTLIYKSKPIGEPMPIWEPMPSAHRLKEAGIKFRKSQSTSILDFRFVHGVLEVPNLTINETTKVIFRNLIRFEECHSAFPNRIITSYAVLFDNLINTKKDLEILCKEGIIENWLNPTVATQFFNELNFNASLKENYYKDLCWEVNYYCSCWWRRCRASYVHNYFGASWAIVSQDVAAVILILTFLQTLFSAFKWD